MIRETVAAQLCCLDIAERLAPSVDAASATAKPGS
jgi:hypothetical protein